MLRRALLLNLYQSHGEKAGTTDTYIGQRVYLHTTALGKAIMASLPSDRVDQIIEQE